MTTEPEFEEYGELIEELKKNRPEEQPLPYAFRASLRARLLSQYPTFAENKKRGLFMMKNHFSQTIAIVALALVMAVSFALIVSPTVMAQLGTWIKQVGTTLYIGSGEKSDELVNTPPVTADLAITTGKMSLDDARAQLPFPIDLPSWVPEGFILNPEVTVSKTQDVAISVFISWESPANSHLGLLIVQRLDGNPGMFHVGEGSAIEVSVNGEPAALTHGIWDGKTQQWVGPENFSLYWSYNNLTYTLNGFTLSDNILSDEDLIRIAQSVR